MKKPIEILLDGEKLCEGRFMCDYMIVENIDKILIYLNSERIKKNKEKKNG